MFKKIKESLQKVFDEPTKEIPEKDAFKPPAYADPDGRYVLAEQMRGSMVQFHECNTRCQVDIARHWVNR